MEFAFGAKMRRIKFGAFMDGKIPDDWRGNLYIVRNRREILYIGITRQGIWMRWFWGLRAHIAANFYGENYSNSEIGSVILKNMPASLKWTIEAWTKSDCIEFLQKKGVYNKASSDLHRQLDIEDVEGEMIWLLKPAYNYMCNREER